MAEQREEVRLDMNRRRRKAIIGAIEEVRTLSKALVAQPGVDFELIYAVRDLLNTYGVTGKFKVHLS